MIVLLKTYSEEEEKSSLQEIKDTVSGITDSISDSVEQVKEYLPTMPEGRFQKVVNQYRKWWEKRKKSKEKEQS
jgi:hypothetical protein